MTKASGRIYRDHVAFWREDETVQNFGDFLTEYLLDRLFLRVPRLPGEIRLVGSYLDDYFVGQAAARAHDEDVPQRAPLVAWAGGVRRPGGLSPEARAQVRILSVRGPLSAQELDLAGAVPLGDPGVLLPALYAPRPVPDFAGRAVCVPHFHDTRPDNDLLALSGANRVLRPNIGRSFAEIEAFIDALTSADFVLCGSLHAAIAAAAYGRPFAFWDSGDIDLPLNWEDFAALVGIDCRFLPDVESGRAFHDTAIRDRIRVPSMWEALAVAPFPIRPDALIRVLKHDLAQHGGAPSGILDTLASTLSGGRSQQDEIAEDARELVESLFRARLGAEARHAEAEGRYQAAEALRAEAVARHEMTELRREAAAAAFVRAAEAGDSLAEAFREAQDRPFRGLRQAVERGALGAALRLGPALSDRRHARLHHSLEKRSPEIPLRHWSEAVARAASDAGVALPPRAPRPVAQRRTLAFRALNLLADIAEPFSKRRASRFRRSAAKRAPYNARSLDLLLPADAEPAPAAPVADPARARRVLVSDYRLPRPDLSAGERATVGLIGDLVAAGFEVVFLPQNMGDDPVYRKLLEDLGARVITNTDGYPYAASYIQEQGHTFGLFYLIRVEVAEALLPSARSTAPDARIVFHAPDLHFLREMRAAELSGGRAEMARALETRRRESAIMRASDHVVLVSPAERPFVEEIVEPDRITVFPALYSPVAADPPGYGARQHLFFLGGFAHSANPPAVRWFVDKVWPAVRAALPDAEFHIIGAEAPPEIVALGNVPGVRFVGYVADLDPVLSGYRLSVVPLLFGAGIKGKVGMALGAGVPTVTTAIGAEGMGIVDGVHAMVHDDAAAFAEAVVTLYRDEATWTRLARNGQRLVAETFGDLANRASFLRALEAAAGLPLDVYVGFCQGSPPLPLPDPDPALPIDVSIIVPVHNQWELTQACLNSVAMGCLATGLRCEVILADDLSTDGTLDAADRFPGLRVVRQEVNKGFLRNCNAAAATARGDALLFLNNDTVVMPMWLEALWRTLKENPEAAFVGSKLVYPDGLIQEAGAVVFSGASAANLGQGYRKEALLWSFDREVDYISGASILVRRGFWDEVGGFDDRYAPAYCEDTDLAMTVRALGRRVVFSARSVVVHFEHGSYGEQPSTPKQHMVANKRRLLKKWERQLSEEHVPPHAPNLVASANAERALTGPDRARRAGGAFNVLVFVTAQGTDMAALSPLMDAMREAGHAVHVVLMEDAPGHLPRSDVVLRLPWRPLPVSDGGTLTTDGWYHPVCGERIRLLCHRKAVDIAICAGSALAPLLDYVPAHALKVIDGRGAPIAEGALSREIEAPGRADVVLVEEAAAASEIDARIGRAVATVVPRDAGASGGAAALSGIVGHAKLRT